MLLWHSVCMKERRFVPLAALKTLKVCLLKLM